MGNKPARNRDSGQHGAARIDRDGATFIVGPLPPSSEFMGYEQAVPGAGDRLLRLAEGEAEHRRTETVKEGLREHVRIMLGQVLGFLMIGGCIAAGVWLIDGGQQVGGMMAVGSGLFTAIVAYLRAYGPNQDK